LANLHRSLEEKTVFTVEEIAQLFDITVQGVHSWLRNKKIRKYSRTSRRGKYQIPRGEVLRVLKLANREVAGLWIRPDKVLTKVLLIDDYEPIRVLAELAFQDGRHCIEMMTASNIEDGLLLAARFEPAVIVLDYFLGKDRLHSDSALSFMRNAKQMKGVKVIGMCGNHRIGLRMLRAGANEILLKPFALEELKDAIFRQASLERRGANRRRPLLGMMAEKIHSN
jgi:CheY-like chemotaxis protein